MEKHKQVEANTNRVLFDKYWNEADLGLYITHLWDKFSKPRARLLLPLREFLKNEKA